MKTSTGPRQPYEPVHDTTDRSYTSQAGVRHHYTGEGRPIAEALAKTNSPPVPDMLTPAKVNGQYVLIGQVSGRHYPAAPIPSVLPIQLQDAIKEETGHRRRAQEVGQ